MTTQKQPTFKKLILNDLKSQGLEAIAAKITSIRYRSFSMGDAVDVVVVDPTKEERETLTKILNEYQHGKFDGMTDCYDYHKSSKSRSAKYVQLEVNFSDAARAQAKAELLKYDVTDDQSSQRVFGCWFDQAVWRKLQDRKAA